MGIWKRKYESGKVRYQIEWDDENGKRCRRTFIDKKTAEQELAKEKREAERRKALGISAIKRVLFEDFGEEYLIKWSKTKKRSWSRDEGLIKNLLTHFRGKYLDQITPYLVEQYRIDREKAVKQSTINREVACLRAIFNKAILWNKFEGKNPVRGKEMFYDEPERERHLSEAQMKKFYEALYHKDTPPMIRNICLCAINTGMRREEILSLKWSQVNWQEKTIKVEFTKNNRVKIVPINEQLEDVLLSIVEYEGCPYVFYHVWKKDGKRNRYKDIKKPWKRILKIAGIEDFRFHDLRHTCGSYLRKMGIDLSVVQKILGHRDIRSTMRYAHVFDEEKSYAVSRLDLVFPRVKRRELRGEYEVERSKITKK